MPSSNRNGPTRSFNGSSDKKCPSPRANRGGSNDKRNKTKDGAEIIYRTFKTPREAYLRALVEERAGNTVFMGVVPGSRRWFIEVSRVTDGRSEGRGRFFLFHHTPTKNVENILKQGLRGVYPGEDRRGPEEINDAIEQAEEMTDAHGQSVFFYNDKDKMDFSQAIVVVDVRKIDGGIQWAEQGPWESLVSQLSEAPYEGFTEEDWDYIAEQMAEEYVSGIERYPSGEEAEEEGEMPDVDPSKQVWVSGDVPLEAIAAIVLPDGTIIEPNEK